MRELKKLIKAYLIFFSIIILVIVLFIVRNFHSSKLEDLKYEDENFLTETLSPSKDYKIRYYLRDGGSLSSDGVLGVLENIESGDEKNIINVYPCNWIDTEWIDNKNVKIKWQDRHDFIMKECTLNIEENTFDWRSKNINSKLSLY